MLFAAGLGTRMKPFTEKHPKALVPVHGKTLLQRNIEYLAEFGFTDLVVNVHHFARQVQEFLEKHQGFGSNITISDESDQLLETGGGLRKAAGFFKDSRAPFVAMNCDILTDLDLGAMVSRHLKLRSLVTLGVSSRKSTRSFLFDNEGRLCGWMSELSGEKKISRQATPYIPMAFSGVQVLSPEIFEYIQMEGKFSVVDLYLSLTATHPIYAYDHTGSRFIDVGKPESIARAEALFP